MRKRIRKIYNQVNLFFSASGHYRLIAALISVVVLTGGILSWWTGIKASRELKREFLSIARIIAEAVNPERIEALKGSDEDILSPHYQRLKEQLWLVRKVMPQFGILYILGMKNSDVFFYVDSEAQGSGLYSPPGRVDRGKNAAFHSVVNSGHAAVTGPYNNEKGEEWISAMIPIYSHDDSRPIAVFCLDMDSREWSVKILGHIAAPAFFTVFIAMALFCYLLFYRYYEDSMKRISVSEEYTKLAIEGAGLGTWEWDIRTGNVTSNDRFIELFGYDRDSLCIKLNRWHQLVHPDEVAHLQKILESNLSGGIVSFDEEHRIRHSSGKWIWVINRGKVIERTVNGEPLKIVGTVLDISGRKKSEQALRESEERFRRIFDESPIGIELYGSDGYMLEMNRACLEILGIGHLKKNLKGYSIYDDPNFNASVIDSIKAGEITGLEIEYDFDLIRKTGYYETSRSKKAFLDITVSVVVYDNSISGPEYLIHIQDVTEKKKAGEEKAAFEKRFQTAQRMESLGLLAGGVAHDFNNILGALQGFAEMALDIVEEKLPGNQALTYIRNVILASNRASGLVDQILTFSRKTDSVRNPLDIAVIVKEAVKMIQASMPSNISVKSSISPGCGRVLADPVHIHQVIMNLCSNARHAMSESGGTLSVELARSAFGEKGIPDHDGEYVRLVITDTGTGISGENLGKIFDPFFTTKKPGEGTGLGLSVVHGIVISCDGAVLVDSFHGKGSSFYVYLPDAGHREEAINIPLADAAVTDGRQIRIMLVDDEKPLLGMIMERLAARGFEVTSFSEPLEALEVFRHNPYDYDVFVTDYWMPGMKGSEVEAAVHDCNPDIPVILMSGHEADSAGNYPDVSGKGTVIRKPLIFNEFFAEIKKNVESEKPKNESGNEKNTCG